MSTTSFKKCCILVVEDEYLLADELSEALEEAGASILGPASTIAEAQALLAAEGPPDAAVLDVNLAGTLVFPLADTLLQYGVPLVFTSGYHPSTFPARFASVPKLGKPIDLVSMIQALARALHSG